MSNGQVPVRESVGEALMFVRQNWRPIMIVAAIASAALTVLAAVSGVVPALALPLTVLSTGVNAFAYAALTSACLFGFAGAGQRVAADGLRVWGAMAVVGFFLAIVFIVLGIPGLIVFAVLIGSRYGEELQQANGDEAAMTELMQRVIIENPGAMLAFIVFYSLIWFALTSRLFLAAPATVEAKRILTFETWGWTRGNVWRVMAARIMLLAPAYILVGGVSYLLGGALGLNITDPASAQSFMRESLPLYLVFMFISGLVQLSVYSALEAGLSTYLYRGLKPAAPPPP